MANSHKILTISIPTWNRANLLKELLNSLITQIETNKLYNEVEIIVSNNASEDNTHEIVDELRHKHSFIVYNRNPVNIGGNPNVMKSMEMASSEYLILLGDDDRMNDMSIPKIVDFLKSNKDIGVVIDSAGLKNIPINRKILLPDLLKHYYWETGNAGVFIMKSSFVKDNLKKLGNSFFNENWSQTQFMILGLFENKNLIAFIDNLDIISHSLHNELTIYNSFYLWRGTYLELYHSIEALKNYIDKETYQAGRLYLKTHILQVSFNILQCGVFTDTSEIRFKTRKHIQKHFFLFSLYENIFLFVIIIILFLPVALSRVFSNIFILLLKGKEGLKRKNEFVKNEKKKIAESEKLKNKSIRKLEFETDNY